MSLRPRIGVPQKEPRRRYLALATSDYWETGLIDQNDHSSGKSAVKPEPEPTRLHPKRLFQAENDYENAPLMYICSLSYSLAF